MISASKEATEPKVSRGYHLESVVVSAITCSTVSEYDHEYVPFVVIIILSSLNS